MHTLFGNSKRARRACAIALLCIAVIGCGVSPLITAPTLESPLRGTPTPSAVSSSTPSPSSTPHKLYLPGVRGGEEDSSASPLPTPSPTPRPTATPWPPPVPKPGYGVQVHLFAGDMEETLFLAQGLGVGWIKQQVEWHTIEHAPGDLDWALVDRVVDGCEAFGFKLLLSVVHAPDWTREVEGQSGPPADYAEFGRFMGQLASRYRGRVAAYELWNEPNLAREWQGDTLDPARFVALVAEGSQGVREADPKALVISGAPAVTGINDGVEAIDDRVFLRGMYEAGVARWVDGIGVHPYGFANPPDESWGDDTHRASSHDDHPSFFFRDTLEDYHAIMLEYGDTKRKLWATEFGWPSVENMGEMDTTGWEYAREVSEKQQAAYIVDAFRMGDERSWVGPMFLWNVDLAAIWGPGNPVSAYSLMRPDGSYRPAYLALRWAEPLKR
jgi:hypothetical protein